MPQSRNDFREENDSLGTVLVPKDAFYGAQTCRALQNFPISGRSAHPALILAYLRIKLAAARANRDCGALTREMAVMIEDGILEIEKIPANLWQNLFPVDPYQAGAGTSQNMNVNEVIANFANKKAGHSLGSYRPVHPNDHVNRSQSTNDTYPTAMRLSLLATSKFLQRELETLSSSFRIKSEEWKNIPKAARTHLQDAVPMYLGQEFSGYSSTLARCARWVGEARETLRELGIGGSAAGTGLNVPPGFIPAVIRELEKETNENLVSAPDLCEAMQSQAPVLYYSSILRITVLELTRICNDLRLLASGPMTGLAEILLPAVQPGSSIMPGKVNPSMLEMANQTWFSVLGFDQTAAYCGQAGQLELNVMMPIMAYSLLEATQVATRAMEALRTRCINGLKANESRLRRYFESTPQVATALSPRLGYEATAKLVSEAVQSGRSVLELVRERKLIPEDELNSLLRF